MRAKSLFGAVFTAVSVSLLVAGCNTVLSIEEAQLGSPDPAPTCAVYCQAVDRSCAADHLKQYPSPSACETFCNQFMKEDDLRCRTNAANTANNPETCNNAGPFGGTVCAFGKSECDRFCEYAQPWCQTPASGASKNPFPKGEEDCNLVCRLKYDPSKPKAGPQAVLGNDGTPATGANTQNCHFYHFMASFGADQRKVHCSHIGVDADPGHCTLAPL